MTDKDELAVACMNLKNVLAMLLEDERYNKTPVFLQAHKELNRINADRGYPGLPHPV